MAKYILLATLLLGLATPASAQKINLPVSCMPLQAKAPLQTRLQVKTIATAKSFRGGKLEIWRGQGRYYVVLNISGRICLLDGGEKFGVSDGA